MNPQRKQAIKMAYELSKQGGIDAAVNVLIDAGVVDEAARMLAGELRYADAARILQHHIGGAAVNYERLDAEQRKLALMAAHYFVKASQTKAAVNIYLGLDERVRAIEALEKAGDTEAAAELKRVPAGVTRLGPSMKSSIADSRELLRARELEQTGKDEAALKAFADAREWKDAGRVARDLGRLQQAARYFMNGELYFEAAVCHIDAGDAESALDCLIRIDRDDPRYRSACMQVIRTAVQFDILTMELDTFLTGFIRSGPADDLEAETFEALGDLYMRHQFPENAREAFKKVVLFNPTAVDAGKKLLELDRKMRGATRDLEQILEEDAAFQSADRDTLRPASEPLDDLPDLPDLPPAPGNEAPAPAPARPAKTSGMAQFQPGSVIADRYRLDELIGQGGMALVLRATDLELDDPVAIKILIQVVMDEDALNRFRRELKVSRQLAHPNIIRVHDIGIHSDHRYITMELLEGETLEDKVGIPMDQIEGIDLVMQACAGLQAAHDKGVIHRDVKPGNFFVTNDGVVKVMDFGLARKTDLPSGLTQLGMVAGTPNYISPEQINRPSEVTAAADLYSLGVVMYEMFTGVLPFSHSELMPLLMMHSTQPPRPPSEHNPEIHPELEAAIVRLLAKEAAERYESCNELAQHLKMIRYQIEQATADEAG